MPTFPGMPYGAAPAWCFPLFEFSMYLLFFFCLRFAMKKGKRDVIYLLGGLAFGLTLEYIEVISDMGYTYGQFTVMFGDEPHNIPLCIGVGWGIIMYTARLFTDSLGLGFWACAALDTLLALNIDLSMDTVAYRMHMWTWNWSGTNLNPTTAQWFGVPFGNFFGWQVVVFCYSAFSRFYEKKILPIGAKPIWRFIAVGALALISSEIILYALEAYIEEFLRRKLGINSLDRFAGTLVILILIVIFGWRKRNPSRQAAPLVSWYVTTWFHLYFFASLFLLGFYLENKWLTIASCTNIAIGICVHVFPTGKTPITKVVRMQTAGNSRKSKKGKSK